jgi:transposase
VTVIAPTVISTAQGALLKSARERMNIISAYHQVGTYRGAAELCGTTHKTVKRVIERAEAGGPALRGPRPRNLDAFTDLVVTRIEKSNGKISAKRLLPIARAAGYQGSARNFRRLVAEQKVLWRKENRHQRRPAVWSPGSIW